MSPGAIARAAVLPCLVGAMLPAVTPGGATAQWPLTRQNRSADFEQFNVPYSGRWVFVRLRFTPQVTGRGGGGGFFGGVNYQWDHDYPRADQHFTTIVRELTGAVPDSGTNIVSVGSPDLHRYPVAYMAEPGWWSQTDDEAANVRAYLRKGGFIIFDDFAGNQLYNFLEQMRRLLPDIRVVEIDPGHEIFHSFFQIEPAQIRATRHPYYGMPSRFLGAFEDNDPDKRLLFIANYNNDIGEAWEWSDRGYIPIALTNEAYKLGVNYLVYAMTH